MPESSNESKASGRRDPGLEISLESIASQIRATDGKDIPFRRAILTVGNRSVTDVVDLTIHASLGQEGGTIHDVSPVFAGAASSVPPGGSIRWDVYDLLIPAHPGTASKVHMFGYRAALNWRFDLAVWAEYRLSGSISRVQLAEARWALRWSVTDPSTGAVGLTIDVT
ncbi:MAG TPA: hypothetical protein VEM40_12700 [Nitrospirota bacterium]|nr:hypothetical protein [Nitrospirota bacterium]